MENGISRPVASEIANSAALKGLRTVGVILAGSALVAISSHVALPLWFTPVPLTLQPFAVLLLGLLLAPRLAAATMGAYLLEGAAGLPVFAPGLALGGGMPHLLGPTGGYLMSYPAAAALIAFLWRRSRRGFGAALLSAAAGDAVILMCGFLWLATLAHGAFSYGSVRTAFALAVLPFLPGDALKVAAAAAIARAVQRARRHDS
jgi:biotin transport system substrate-specific component